MIRHISNRSRSALGSVSFSLPLPKRLWNQDVLELVDCVVSALRDDVPESLNDDAEESELRWESSLACVDILCSFGYHRRLVEWRTVVMCLK
jgi:hypothetical protein